MIRFDATTLWHFDAAERAPSTTSFADARLLNVVSMVVVGLLAVDLAVGKPASRWASKAALCSGLNCFFNDRQQFVLAPTLGSGKRIEPHMQFTATHSER